MNKRDNMKRELNGVKQSFELLQELSRELPRVQGDSLILLMIHSELATMNEKLDDLYKK